MNEGALDREPIELVEIILPRCINVYGVAPCTATGPAGGECFNCRNTCQSVDNYRDTPDRHLTPTLIRGDGETIGTNDNTRTADIFAGIEVYFASVPEGVIWEQGDSATRGAYLGVTSGNLVFRAGDATVASGANTGKISVPAAQFAGKSITLYTEIDFNAGATSTLRLWAFDMVELTLTLLGTSSWTASVNWAAGTDGGAIGMVGGSTVPVGESAANWNGGITIARFYSSTSAPADMSDNFRQSVFLGRGEKGEPIDEAYILPTLRDLGTISSRINLNAADDNYEPLGRRATLDFTCADFTHSDIGQDPYVATRPYDPRERSTFWRKWLIRQKFGRVGALVRVYDGYAGQRLSDYRVRSYVLDSVKYDEDMLSFHCRDVLSRTEFRRAQLPILSSGKLGASIATVGATSFTILGDVTADYPATGTVRINDEVMTYSSRAAAGSPLVTTFSGLVRGTDGSTAAVHAAGDLVQTCQRYTNASIAPVVTSWLVDSSRIPAQLIDLVEIESEVTAYLNAYQITTLISEPTGISELLGLLSEECSFFIWWDDRSQKVRLKAIRALAITDANVTWTYEENIVGGSFMVSEYPKQRLNVVAYYFNPRDFAGDLGKPSNFKNGLKIVNGTSSLPEQYGDYVQTREVFSRFLTTEAQVSQTGSRLSVRYADVPQFVEFYVDAKDRSVWTGDYINLSHPLLVDALGRRDVRRWLIVEAEEVDPGHLIKYVCADITLDGLIYVITDNAVTTYDPVLFAEGKGFIADNAGFNPDGTLGARIS